MPLPAETRRAVVLLAAVSLVLLIAGTAALPLLDRDEPRFARATVEMIERGDWVIPWFNDGYRFDKPPLTYWLMAIGYALFGVGELGARVHSVLAATATTLVLYGMGRRMFDARVGLAAGFGWATCLQVYLHGRLALADMPMILAVLVAHWALWELLFADGGSRWRWTLWVALAAGFLAKGPIALIAPAITLAFVRVVGRSPLPWRRFGATTGAPLALGLVGAWGIPALIRTGGEFWNVGIGHHVVERGLDAFNDRPIVPFYYLVTIFLSLLPWSPNLGQLIEGWRSAWSDARVRFLTGWIAGPLLVFSFYSTQLPHYTLPAFPALLLLLFRNGEDPRAFGARSRGFYIGLHALFAALFIATAIGLRILEPRGEAASLAIAAAMLAVVLLALQVSAITFALRRDDSLPALAPALVALAVVAVATSGFARTIRPLTAPIRLQPFHERVPRAAPHLARGYTEPSLVFYGDATWNLAGDVPGADELAEGPRLLVFRGDEMPLDRLLRGAAIDCSPEGLQERARRAGVPRAVLGSDLERAAVCGLNLARTTWTELFVFYRE